MEIFEIIQRFFTQMTCDHCHHSFEPGDIDLLRQQDELFVVNVFCHHCDTHNGIALVGVQASDGSALPTLKRYHGYDDPELTKAELERLAEFEPIAENDVLEAHEFIQDLDANWMQQIPQELREAAATSIQDDRSGKSKQKIEAPKKVASKKAKKERLKFDIDSLDDLDDEALAEILLDDDILSSLFGDPSNNDKPDSDSASA